MAKPNQVKFSGSGHPACAAELLRALAGHPRLGTTVAALPDEEALPAVELDLTQLSAQVDQAWEMVHASAHDQVGPLLAGLVGDLEEATRSDPSERPSALWLLGQVYQMASAMLAQVGESPGACLAGDRAVAVGDRAGDRPLVAAGQFRLAHAYAAAGCDNLALRVLHDVSGIHDAAVVAGLVRLIGACKLLEAVLEARSGDPERAWAHLARAGGLAARVDLDDGDPYGTEFGPANVALHHVSVAIELGQPGEALSVAKRIDTAGLSLERRRRLVGDIARAQG